MKFKTESLKIKVKTGSRRNNKQPKRGAEMKKFASVVLMIMLPAAAFGLEHVIELRTELLYTTYMKNDVYDVYSGMRNIKALEAYEKFSLRFTDTPGMTKFTLDARGYVYPDEKEAEFYVDNAYFQVASGPFIAYFGKQRLKWGTGYTWNPTDVLQPQKNALEPTEDLEGIYAVRMEYSNPFMTPSLIIAAEPSPPDEEWSRNFRSALQLYKLIGTADVFLNGVYRQDDIQSAGAAVAWDINWFVLNLEGAAIRYMNKTKSALRASGESGPEDIRYSYLIGISKLISSDSSVYLEYYRNGWGMTNAQFDSFVNKSFYGAQPELLGYLGANMKKNYFALNLSYTWYDKIGLNMAAVYGADDGSFLLYPNISYVENTGWDITLGIMENLPRDEKNQNYYTMPFYNAAQLRVNAYF